MEQIQMIMETQVVGNSVLEWSIALGVFLAVFMGLRIARAVILKRIVKLAKKTDNEFDDVVAQFLTELKLPIYLLAALFVAMQGLNIPESINFVLELLLLVVVVSQVISILEDMVCMLMENQLKKSNAEAKMPAVFRIALRMVLWSIGGLMILSNLGVNVNSLIAGLGIGGLAISLALQNVLSDLFASFSIAVDRPFEIGDFIIVGEHKGTVKHIGLKTTRITALQGEEVVISNAELTTARVQNYKKMEKRRIVFKFGCTYSAKTDQLKDIVESVGKIIDDHKLAEVSRVHFKEFGESELSFEAVYLMLTSDYTDYMNTQQDINIKIMQYFDKNGLEMAYPTQTLYVKKEE